MQSEASAIYNSPIRLFPWTWMSGFQNDKSISSISDAGRFHLKFFFVMLCHEPPPAQFPVYILHMLSLSISYK